MRQRLFILAVLPALLAVATGPAMAACQVIGKADEQIQLRHRPGGPLSGVIVAGANVQIQGGGHDANGQAWSFIARLGGGASGWLRRSQLRCR
jgi:hypothetical protein